MLKRSCKTKQNFPSNGSGHRTTFMDQFEAFLLLFSSHVVFVIQKLVLFKRKFAVLLIKSIL